MCIRDRPLVVHSFYMPYAANSSVLYKSDDISMFYNVVYFFIRSDPPHSIIPKLVYGFHNTEFLQERVVNPSLNLLPGGPGTLILGVLPLTVGSDLFKN